MDALVPSGWTDFAVAAAGASAALAGLTIVTISVNVRQILASPALVPRSAVTIAGFVTALLASLATLMPQSARAAGIEVLVVAVIATAMEVHAFRADTAQSDPLPTAVRIGHAVTAGSWIAAFLVAAVLLIAAAPTAGMFALALGVGAAIVASLINTWVLLIEILR